MGVWSVLAPLRSSTRSYMYLFSSMIKKHLQRARDADPYTYEHVLVWKPVPRQHVLVPRQRDGYIYTNASRPRSRIRCLALRRSATSTCTVRVHPHVRLPPSCLFLNLTYHDTMNPPPKNFQFFSSLERVKEGRGCTCMYTSHAFHALFSVSLPVPRPHALFSVSLPVPRPLQGPCMEFLLRHKILNLLYTTGTSDVSTSSIVCFQPDQHHLRIAIYMYMYLRLCMQWMAHVHTYMQSAIHTVYVHVHVHQCLTHVHCTCIQSAIHMHTSA